MSIKAFPFARKGFSFCCRIEIKRIEKGEDPMKKIMALVLTAVMTLSMGVTAFGATAYPSNDKIKLNHTTEYYMQPYRIDGNNYFQLRAVCGMLQYTVNAFDLNWYRAESKTVIHTQTKGMDIFNMAFDGVFRQTTATPVDALIEVDGKEVTLQAYNIKGYNYFKLRDLADLIGFEVGWDAASKTVNIVSPYGSAPNIAEPIAVDEEKVVYSNAKVPLRSQYQQEDGSLAIPYGDGEVVNIYLN